MEKPKTIHMPVIVLVGPTAIGKTALSLELAARFHCEIISMDSMQVYRYMDIGTAKATPLEQAQVPHYLIDICDPDEQYNAARFIDDAALAMDGITSRSHIPLITGGTGMYLSALVNGLFSEVPVEQQVREMVRTRFTQQGRAAAYQELQKVDPESAQRIHVNDTQRLLRALEIYHSTGVSWSEHLQRQHRQPPPICFSHLLVIGLHCDRARLYRRIEERTAVMMESGLLEEVEGLLHKGYQEALPSMQAIGYRHAVNYLRGRRTLTQTTDDLVRDTRRYAKRQMTWFNKVVQLQWFEQADAQQVIDAVHHHIDHANP